VLNGLGLHSFKKYLSLITGYTDKTVYTAIEHLRHKNNVVLKPKKSADIYSFGIILYEMVTKNRQYRQLPLKDIQLKFVEESFRPKLPDNIKHEVKNLIRKCWNETIEKRPTIDEVI
jgi:serine/threonine protein kinase